MNRPSAHACSKRPRARDDLLAGDRRSQADRQRDARTPEVEAVGDAVHRSLADAPGDDLLDAPLAPAALTSFDRAAAALFRARPWESVPSAEHVMALTNDVLGMRDAIVSLIGHAGQEFGRLLFPSVEDYEAFLATSEQTAAGERSSSIPPHLALSFERREQISARSASGIRARRLPVAGPAGYPRVFVFDRTKEPCRRIPPPSRRSKRASRLVVQIVGDGSLQAAFAGGEPVHRRTSVQTAGGRREIAWRAPCEELESGRGGSQDEAIFGRFVASPEGRALGSLQFVPLAFDFAERDLERSIRSFGPDEVRAMLFEWFPRKVSVPASAASAILVEYRALFTRAPRTHGRRRAACASSTERSGG